MSTFGYVTIPATALISIAFLGFLKIGEEIENPFGYGKPSPSTLRVLN
jgi:predicted membrane chloride channel (bestrophin family)